jgi:kanosamine 6-kinase
VSDGRAGQLGIDIGGTKVAFIARPEPAARCDAAESGWPELRRDWPLASGLSADLDSLAAWCAEVRAASPAPIGSVGASVPATLGPDGQVITWPNRPHWVGFELLAFLRREFPGASISYSDDGNLAALAEARESGQPDLAYLGVGTGVGGGLVLGGKVRPTLTDGCELGHLIIDSGGPACTCGRRGCLQAVASGPATLRRARLARGREIQMGELTAGYADGEGWAVAAVTESAAALAVVVVNLTELLKIGLVRIGGGFAAALTGLIPVVAAETARLARPGHPPARVEPAVFGADSSLHGALLLADARVLDD